MFEITMPIGDWSDDGHGKCIEVDFISNYDVNALRGAYRKSVETTNVSFDFKSGNDAVKLCVNHGDSIIPANVMKQFVDLGYKETSDLVGDTQFEPELFGKLILWFIGLSMPDDWEWSIKNRNKVYLNGFWNDDLNVQFGYGMFW
jgi:hypothetical protein